MNERVRDRATAAFAASAAALGRPSGLAPALRVFRDALDDNAARLNGAMRVALVGRVSSGKSTLANALLGGEFAPVGVEELTFNVNWITLGAERTVTVYFRDGRAAQSHSIAELKDLTVRARDGDDAKQELLAAVDYLLVTDPNPYLAAFDLIDTPGLDSAFQTDSQNTLRFLGRSADDVRESSITQASKADALVAVFARGLAASERDLLVDFDGDRIQAGGPISTIGALTKIELAWPGNPDPMAEGRRLADVVMNSPGAARVLYDLKPVASLVGAGAATMTEPEFGDLVALSRADGEIFAKRLKRGPYFGDREYPDLPVPAAGRSALMKRLGQYGIWLSTEFIRQGVSEAAELRTELIARSGITEFKRVLVQHFGNRADLIRVRGQLDALHHLGRAISPSVTPRDRLGLTDAVRVLNRLEQNEHAFAELAVLRQFYEGLLTFAPEEGAELLRVTGEYGISVPDRLGIAVDAPAASQLSVARERLDYWASRDIDPGYAGPTRRAVQVLRRTYERMVAGLAASSGSPLAAGLIR